MPYRHLTRAALAIAVIAAATAVAGCGGGSSTGSTSAGTGSTKAIGQAKQQYLALSAPILAAQARFHKDYATFGSGTTAATLFHDLAAEQTAVATFDSRASAAQWPASIQPLIAALIAVNKIQVSDEHAVTDARTMAQVAAARAALQRVSPEVDAAVKRVYDALGIPYP